jgi:hypothetical protein
MTPVDFLNEMRAHGGKEALTIVTPTPEALSGALGKLDGDGKAAAAIRVEVVANILAPAVGLLAVRRARVGILGDSLTLEANYVRRTDAELKWKAL